MRIPFEHFRDRLLARRRQLLGRYQSQQRRIDEELDTREIEDVENATEQYDATWLSRLGDLDKRRLDAIVAALRRIEAGNFGVCVRCGQPIDRERLDALPEAPTCIRCADELAAETPPPPP